MPAASRTDPTTSRTEHKLPWPTLLLALLGAIGFSGKAIIAKLAYRHGVDAITLVMYRMLMALPLFLLLSWWAGRGQPPLARRDWVAVAGLGVSGYYLASTLDFLGLQYISASLERLILYLNPTLVLLLNWALFRRRTTGLQLACMGLSYAGVVLVFGHEWAHVGSNAPLGAALVFGSAISYALYLVYCAEVVNRIGVLRLTGLATTAACVLCIGQFLLLRPLSAAQVAAPVLWLSLINSVFCTFVPMLLTTTALARLGATVSAQIGMVGPMSTVLLGVFLLGEPLTVWVAAGTVLVMAGVGLLVMRRG
jgi:drug/metabolite transporter (DMT)-like permease